VVALTMLLAGCAPAETEQVRDAAVDFQTRVAAQDWPAACGLLSDQARGQVESTTARPCAQALAPLRLSGGAVGEVQVWGANASARIPSGTVFLSRFGDGWRVIGAGCTWRGEDRPYDCSVRG
jgi:hypothetical protein